MNRHELIESLRAHMRPHLAESLTDDMTVEDALGVLAYLTSQRQTFATYLPRYLVSQLVSDPVPGYVSGGFRYGAVMLTDVSGFTAMSEQLAVLGKEGAEQITTIVNDFFDHMLEISSKRNGDLLKFGGDSLLLFFEGSEGPRRAIFTAAAMQRAMGRFEQIQTSEGVFSLELSIGIGCGPLFLANLGSLLNMEFSAIGAGLSNMALAEDRASAGQVIVDQSTFDAVKSVAAFAPVGDGFWLFESLLEGEIGELLEQCAAQLSIIEKVRPFLLGDLFDRLMVDPNRRTLSGSHRLVTVLFANFYGIDEIMSALEAGNETAITEILNLHFETMSHILARYGGVINKVDTYSVGHRIMALFGALHAHEDDPVRAVHAALEMNRALKDVNQKALAVLADKSAVSTDVTSVSLRQRIGINSGFVFAGDVGSAARREYTVMGDEVNLAARLMSVAQEGQVLISQSTARHVRDRFALLEMPLVEVKGKSHPVRSYVVTGLLEKPRERSYRSRVPFVGRERELAIGRNALDRALTGAGQVLSISGVSGIGKTRLTEEIVAYGRSVNMAELSATCISYGESLPHRPWVDVLREALGMHPDDDPGTRAAALLQELQELGEEAWAPVIGDVLGLNIPDNELTGGLDAKLRRQRSLELILALIRSASSRRPLMLVIEDAHWADPASMEVIDYVANHIAQDPILFILTFRRDAELSEWEPAADVVDLALGDLPADECLDIARAMTGNTVLPHALVDFVLGRSSGNPFFVEEVVRALIDSDVLIPSSSGAWELARNLDQVALPDTIHGIVISRLDRLAPVDRQVLQVASVIGRVFDLSILQSLFPHTEDTTALDQRLDYLSELGLIEHQSEQDYRFKHLTTRDVVYDSQSFGRRRDLHRRIGALLEHECAETLNEQAGVLAYHYWEGQEWTKAIEYNLLTARRAQREYANGTAVMAYERVLEAGTRSGADTTVVFVLAHESLGEVFTLLGTYDSALQHYAAARGMIESRFEGPDQRTHLADLCRKTAEVYERRSEYDVAFQWLDRGLEYLDRAEPSIETVRIFLLGIGIHRRQGKNDDAFEWCSRSLDVASKIRTREARQAVGRVYYNLGGIFNVRGDLRQAVEFCRRSVELYQEINDVVGLSQAYINLANAYSEQGDWTRASEVLHKSLDIKQQIGDVLHQGFISNNLGNVYLYRGQWREAADLFEQSNRIWQRLQAPLPEAVTLSNLAQVLIYRGDWSEARDSLARSEAIFAEIGSEDYLAELERRWAELFLSSGELDYALAHAGRSVEIAEAQDARLEAGMSRRVLGQVYLARGETELAETEFRASLHILIDLNSQYQAAKTLLGLVRVDLARQPTPATRAQLMRAMNVFQELGAQADLAEAERLAARVPS